MIKNFLKLFSGNALAQAIQFAALIPLTIIYDPSDFGLLGQVQSVSSIIVILLTLQLQYIIPLSKDPIEAKDSIIKLFQIVFVIGFTFSIASLFISKIYFTSVLLAIILGFVNIMNNYLVYLANFGLLSKTYVFRAVIIVFLQLMISNIAISNGLLVGAIAGEFVTLIFLLLLSKTYRFFKFKISINEIKKLIIKWKPYSLYGTIQEVLSVMVYSLPMIFYIEKFDANIGGQYSMAYKLIWAPVVLVTSSISQVLTHKFGKEKDYNFVRKFIWFDKRLIIIVLIAFVILFYMDFVNVYIGDKWSLAIKLLPYMFINGVFFLYAMPYRVALRVLKKNKMILYIEVFTLILMSLLFIIFNVNVIVFTILITSISIIQNFLIALSYQRLGSNKLKI